MCAALIMNPNTRCFTSYNEKGVFVWNPANSETLFQIDIANITTFCYSSKYHLYFVFTAHLSIYVLNEYLNLVKELKTKVTRFGFLSLIVQKAYFVEETQQLITAGVSGCYLI